MTIQEILELYLLPVDVTYDDEMIVIDDIEEVVYQGQAGYDED